jgi:hypothetical protein
MSMERQRRRGRQILMASLFLSNCSDRPESRLLTVGGVHTFESAAPCRLARAAPPDAVANLGWPDTLALEARAEGTAVVECGSEAVAIRAVAPARLTIAPVDDADPTRTPVGAAFKVRARLFDSQDRELEVGKFTVFDWTPSGILEVANSPSSGEFGLCETCFGLHTFRAVGPGRGLIEVRFQGLRADLEIAAIPPGR